MSKHPLNLGVRFLMEILALIVMGLWGWQQREGIGRFLLAVGIPVVAAVLWGTFAVPEDPSRSGKAPVPVPGWVRLILEIGFFGLAVWMLFHLQMTMSAWIFAGLVGVHYVISYDRIGWLLRR